ncbi:hypothetical protein OBBRIDRAFT_789841 [Obba rivulosa]|uniref:Uncharacterized protein n=1 Tax=Obba rivulosa TaxID=1052685 RepID=A0A8E2J3F0_9APHY|nr:hypothetical protein OBBRIDRAFT_789841 [Obba rivulosa]
MRFFTAIVNAFALILVVTVVSTGPVPVPQPEPMLPPSGPGCNDPRVNPCLCSRTCE